MNKTAGHMMGYMGLMDDDAKMLCKVLEISAAQALALKKKIKMGHKLPSWAEYKVYKAGDALKSALASTHSMRDHMPRISIAIKSAPPMGSVLPSNMKKMASPVQSMGRALNPAKLSQPPKVTGAARKKHKMPKMPKAPVTSTMLRTTPMPMQKEGMMGNSPFTQQMMKGSGLPGYSKGGPVKKDGYLTDKKGKPYARVHKGERVVPKDEKTKKAWAVFAKTAFKLPKQDEFTTGGNIARLAALALLAPVGVKGVKELTKAVRGKPFQDMRKLDKALLWSGIGATLGANAFGKKKKGKTKKAWANITSQPNLSVNKWAV